MSENLEEPQKIQIKKEDLDYFNSILDTVKSLGLIFVALSAISFFLFPDFEVFVRDKILDESACFYVGKWDNSDQKFKNDMQYDLVASDYDKSTGLVKIGNVLLADSEISVGRTVVPTGCGIQGLRKYAIMKYDCIYVLKSYSTPIKGDGNFHAIWARALPKACKN